MHQCVIDDLTYQMEWLQSMSTIWWTTVRSPWSNRSHGDQDKTPSCPHQDMLSCTQTLQTERWLKKIIKQEKTGLQWGSFQKVFEIGINFFLSKIYNDMFYYDHNWKRVFPLDWILDKKNLNFTIYQLITYSSTTYDCG